MGGSRYPSSGVGWSAGDSSFISSAGPGVKVVTCFPGSHLQPQPSHRLSSCSNLSMGINKKTIALLEKL